MRPEAHKGFNGTARMVPPVRFAAAERREEVSVADWKKIIRNIRKMF